MCCWQVGGCAGSINFTVHNGKSRIQALLDEHRPALVILEIGGNDFLRRAAPTAVMEDIRQLIKTSLQAGAQVALVAVPELSVVGIVVGKPRDSSVYAELCADRIHPNALGYQHMQQLGWVA